MKDGRLEDRGAGDAGDAGDAAGEASAGAAVAADDADETDVADDAAGIVFHPHSVAVVERGGFREFRCVPATWSYAAQRPFAQLMAEFYSTRMGADPHGLNELAEFWSGSDAALRLRATAVDDLALRELHALATRRSVGLNAPKPWAARADTREFSAAWEPEARDVHLSQVPIESGPESLWTHYGMERSHAEPVVVGFGMRSSLRAPLGRRGEPRAGGPGTWYRWSTLLDWERWPRRQDAGAHAMPAEPRHLLLFVSHRWESLDHPDPSGAQLLCVKVGLTLALAAAVLRHDDAERARPTFSGLPELIGDFLDDVIADETRTSIEALRPWTVQVEALARAAHTEDELGRDAHRLDPGDAHALLAEIRDRVLVWYDYASMHQQPRTAEEQIEFRAEILTLNAIQAHAGTLVIAGNEEYLSRAWCFLELCGGMRHRIVELVPSWGTRVGLGDSVTRWAARSDQLIGALHAFGAQAITRSGLQATHAEDLPDIARLLQALPLTALIDTDDSDLVGGELPLPFRAGAWMLGRDGGGFGAAHELDLPPLDDFGVVPTPDTLEHITEHAADEIASLEGPVGVWVYTTQRMLTLAWAERAGEVWARLQTELSGHEHGQALENALEEDGRPFRGRPGVARLWADARALADDGLGWTRVVPSTVRLLVIVTQTDVPDLCRIHDLVVHAHIACGVPVITYSPDSGRTLVYLPTSAGAPRLDPADRDVLAVPRSRRSEMYPRRLFVPPGATEDDVAVLAALRLDPGLGVVPPGELMDVVAAEGPGEPGDAIGPRELLAHSHARVHAEALARSTAATWGEWCTRRLTQGAWQVGMAQLQVQVIARMVAAAHAVSDNPFVRRRLIDVLVQDHEGYALPPSIVADAETLIGHIRARSG